MASTLISNPVTNSTPSADRALRDSSRTRKKKSKRSQTKLNQNEQQVQQSHTKWKSEAQQQIYSSKLLQALHHVPAETSAGQSSSSTCPPRRGKAVREAADRVLATAAKGRTRWSRAILKSRLKIKFRQQKRRGSAAAAASGGRIKKQKFSVWRLRGKGLPAVQKKVRVLGRLVPGCRKQPLPVILEEATDYIAALEMQVRAMSRLTQLLSVSGGSGASPPLMG